MVRLDFEKQLNNCIDWQKVDKDDYLIFMRLSPANSKYINRLLNNALTDQINDREVFIKGIDKSYEYEDLTDYSMDQIESESKSRNQSND